MGERNLTVVIEDGEVKIAQYAQWGGHPSGEGLRALRFLKDEGNVTKLKTSLKKVRFIDIDGVDKEFVEAYNKNTPTCVGDSETRTAEQLHWFNRYVSRNIGAEILSNISNSTDEEITLRNSIGFASDSLMCEYACVIDFDKGTFESYEGFNESPLEDGERFKDMETREYTIDTKYYQIAHTVTFKLDDLPTEDEFLGAFSEEG